MIGLNKDSHALLDPVDLTAKISAQQANLERSKAALADAQLRLDFAQTQRKRYTDLLSVKATQEEQLALKKQELRLAESSLTLIKAEVKKAAADLQALETLKQQLTLTAPIAGKVVARLADVGNTAMAGQVILELVNPEDIWIQARFDQVNAQDLATGLTVSLKPRSQTSTLTGVVARIEPKADAVTEEFLAKISLDRNAQTDILIGELVSLTVALPSKSVAMMLPNAAIQRQQDTIGVWRLDPDNALIFTPVTLGKQDLTGQVEVLSGVTQSDRVVLYSQHPLSAQRRVILVNQLVDAKL